MVASYQDIYEYLTAKGFKPQLNVTDNEFSKVVQNYIYSQIFDWQLVEPDNHRVNAAKRAIQTFKNHFISGLATVNVMFTLQLWCYLISQAKLILNIIRTSYHDPSKSACEVLKGKFDYNTTPLAPPVTKYLIYEAPTRQATWAPHAVNGWYLGPAMNHYLCGHFFIISTRATRIVITTKLFPTKCALPTLSEEEKKLLRHKR